MLMLFKNNKAIGINSIGIIDVGIMFAASQITII